MRLGFHYHVPGICCGKGIKMPSYQGRFVEALADTCTEVVCFLHSPLPREREQMDFVVQRSNVRLVPLGPHISVPRRILSVPSYRATLRREKSQLDAFLIRGPSPLLPSLATGVWPLPTALLLVGDAVSLVGDSHQPFWRGLAIQGLWRWNRYRQDRVARRSLTFVNSRQLYRAMSPTVRNLMEVRTTTLTRADGYSRTDTCLKEPFNLLYTGRMTRGKGLIEMVEAIAMLVEEGIDAGLDLVGWPEKGDDVLEELRARAEGLRISNRIRIHGPKPVGPELFKHYREADVFVIASKTSEGFPRTIWEAMAHSLPVVATRVGSIPDFVDNAAVLVEPNSAKALAAALRRLFRDPDLRQRCIYSGRNLAASVTLELQTEKMINRLKSWVGTQA